MHLLKVSFHLSQPPDGPVFYGMILLHVWLPQRHNRTHLAVLNPCEPLGMNSGLKKGNIFNWSI